MTDDESKNFSPQLGALKATLRAVQAHLDALALTGAAPEEMARIADQMANLLDHPALVPSRLEGRRRRAVEAVRRSAALADERGVIMVVFGALASDRFGLDSRVEVALDGPPEAVQALEPVISQEIRSAGLEANIVDLERADDALREQVIQQGIDPAAL